MPVFHATLPIGSFVVSAMRPQMGRHRRPDGSRPSAIDRHLWIQGVDPVLDQIVGVRRPPGIRRQFGSSDGTGWMGHSREMIVVVRQMAGPPMRSNRAFVPSLIGRLHPQQVLLDHPQGPHLMRPRNLWWRELNRAVVFRQRCHGR